MARPPRKEVFEADVVGCYHCINRCVRRAYLCGDDPVTGRSFHHRKGWIRERLQQLAAQFALDVLDYVVMSNHMHVILRNRPDIVAQWSDKEVARRWWNLFPGRKDKRGQPAQPTAQELRAMTTNRKRMKELRKRLSHISWFMRCLAENIARRANAEDDISGRFWSGRFKATRLLDTAALLACSIYVDLNPIRAGIARTPETSRYTSAYDRIHSLKGKQARKNKKSRRKRPTARSAQADAWLSPVPLDRTGSQPAGCGAPRASDRGFLPMQLSDYLQLLDWTGRQMRRDKPGRIPSELAPILERLKIVPERWSGLVQQFGRWFGTAAGTNESLASEAKRRKRHWLHGVARSRQAFAC
jgi:REP element-mobilizing transposase RayT